MRHRGTTILISCLLFSLVVVNGVNADWKPNPFLEKYFNRNCLVCFGSDVEPLDYYEPPANVSIFVNETYADSVYVHRDDWTTHDNYPGGCSANQYVSSIGDSLTCGTPIDTDTFNTTNDIQAVSVGGEVTGTVGSITINNNALDDIYLKLDASNDPITGDLSIDDGAGNTPQLKFIGGSNDDTANIYLIDDGDVGESDLAIQLTNDTVDSRLIFQNNNGDTIAYMGANSDFIIGNPSEINDYHFAVYDGEVSADSSYFGSYSVHQLRGGINNTGAFNYGLFARMEMNQSSRVVGDQFGIRGAYKLIDGEIGQAGSTRDAYGILFDLDLDDGTVWDDSIAMQVKIDQEAEHENKDMLIGMYVWMDPDGTNGDYSIAYRLYESSAVDYLMWSPGNAESYIGGNVGIGTQPSYPLEVDGHSSGISIYASNNISAEDYLYHSAFPDSGYDALNDMLLVRSDGHGKLDHSTVPSNSLITIQKPKYYNNITKVFNKETGEIEEEGGWVYTGTEEEELVSMTMLVGNLVRSVQQLNEENIRLRNRIDMLEVSIK